MKDAVEGMQLQAATAGLDDFNRKLTEFIINNSQIPGFAKALGQYLTALEKVTATASQKKITDFIDEKKFQAATAGLTGINLLLAQMKHNFPTITDAQILEAEKWQMVIDKAEA